MSGRVESGLVSFYRGERSDAENRLLQQLWGWTDEDLEEVHDYIQWLFPLPEPSGFNPKAPLLTDEDIAAFKSDPLLQANLGRSFQRILTFLGLSLTEEGRVVEGPNFSARAADVWRRPNHNWLRVTRILRSLYLLGLEALAEAFFTWLAAAYRNRWYPIPDDVFQFWSAAAKGLLFEEG
jgi:hypothetical protein